MDEDYSYAGFWIRCLASIIDTLWLYAIIYFCLWLVLGSSIFDPNAGFSFTQFFLGYLFPFVIVMVFWITKSSTPGKMIFNIKIVDAETHEKATNSRLFIRYFAYFISMIPLFLGFFWVAWDKKKQGWHDKIAHTVLIIDSK